MILRRLKLFKLGVACAMLACVASMSTLPGCAWLQPRPAAKYKPGENFDKNGQSCGTQQYVDGKLPWCPKYPNDGDAYTQRFGTK